MRPFMIVLILASSALVACTSDDPESSVVDTELLNPDSPQVQGQGHRADQGDPSRTGSCPQLSGQALRDCLERAQYQPEGAQDNRAEPQSRRPDPGHALPDPDGASKDRGEP